MTTSVTGVVTEIERFAVNDGPGIRTVVFFKGCPLRCRWCANPETKSKNVQLMYWLTRCIGCKRCIALCPNNSLSWDDRIVVDRKSCTLCGVCASECNSDALTQVGSEKTVDEVLQLVLRDKPFYDKSGGGVTFSGGEALLQPDFLAALASATKQAGLHTAMETSGYFPWSSFEKILPVMDLFLYDLKHMNPEKHQMLCGVDTALIHDNLRRLRESGKQVFIRIPVLPGINTDQDNLDMMADFLATYHPGCRISLLPYHRLGISKYERLDEGYELQESIPPTEEELAELAAFFTQNGFTVAIGE